jgi:hypothetical protein
MALAWHWQPIDTGPQKVTNEFIPTYMIPGYGKLYGLRTLPGGVILCAASGHITEEEGKLINFPIMMFPDGSHITLSDILVSEDNKIRIYWGSPPLGKCPPSRARCVMHLCIVGFATGTLEG